MHFAADLPCTFDGDVLVAGGGPAGVAAALSAARAGARVLLVERMGFLGGAGTAMQVPAFAPFSDRTRAIVRGIGWEVLTEMSARTGRPVPTPDVYEVPQDTARMDWAPIDGEVLKRLYDDLCEAAGVEVLFHTFVPEVVGSLTPRPPSLPVVPPSREGGEATRLSGLTSLVAASPPPSLEGGTTGREGGRGVRSSDGWEGSRGDRESKTGGTLQALVLANKSGLSLARARVFVDATGDADLAARAGCPTEQGDAEGRTQGMTLCFTIAGGSRTAYLEYVYRTGDGYLAKLVAAARANGDFDLPDASLVGLVFKNETVAGANMGHVYEGDATDAGSVARAEREGRRVVAQLLPFIRKYVPGQENAFLVSTGPHIGVRESRRIVGDYRLTLDDYLTCRTFPDDIARCAYFIDLHAVTSAAAARAKAISAVSDAAAKKKSHALPPGQSHGIPYRCLLPQGVENLIVAGRSLSADREVQGATRVMPYAFATGEAAGLAAALAAAGSGRFRDVDVALLRTRLRAQGAWLPEDG